MLIFLLAWVPLAQGQIMDTEPDVIGFFADPVGNYPGVCEQNVPRLVYLMITHPSDTSGLLSYQCSFTIPDVVTSLGFQSAGTIISEDIFPVLDIEFTAPVPATGETYILGTWNIFLAEPGQGAVLLADHFPYEYYAAAYRTVASGDVRIPVHTPDWSNGMPTAPGEDQEVLWINHPEYCRYVVGDRAMSWGGVKGLYR